jgi:hypothetical protein
MGFGSTDLVHPLYLAAPRKRSQGLKYPLTPIFNDLADGGKLMSMIRFTMTGLGATQYAVTNTFPAPAIQTVICGNAKYRVTTIAGHYTYLREATDPDPEVEGEEGEGPAAYVTDILTKTYTHAIVLETTPEGEAYEGSPETYFVGIKLTTSGDGTEGWAPSPTHSQTATYAKQGDENNAGTQLNFGGNPLAGETVTVGSETYTWRASVGTAANEIKIGADTNASRNNLIAAMTQGAGKGTLYGSNTTEHPNTYATARFTTSVTLQGPAGTATTETLSNGSFVHATLQANHYVPYVWKEFTLTELADRAYLEGKLVEWKAQTFDFRMGTDTSGSLYEVGMTSESIDGYASVIGGNYRFRNVNPFSKTLPTPDASDRDLWDGNYFAHILVSRRSLSPTLYSTQYDGETGVGGSNGRVSSAVGIYNSGFSEDKLTDLIETNIWRDDYGVFDVGSGLVTDAPKFSFRYFSISDFAFYVGEGKGHEIVFVTRNGLRTRLTIERVEYGYEEEEPWGETITVLSSEQIVTDPSTLRVAYTHDPPDPEADTSLRVGSVEQLVNGEWVSVGGDEVIGGDPSDPTAKVLQYFRRRSGQRWGVTEFETPYEARYRTRTFTKELALETSLPAEAEDAAECGDVVEGELRLTVVKGFSETTGLQLPDEATTFSMTVGMEDWTAENYDALDSHVFGSTTINTTTTLRKVMATIPRVGRYFIKKDEYRVINGSSNAANRIGKVISSEWVRVSVTAPTPVPAEGAYATYVAATGDDPVLSEPDWIGQTLTHYHLVDWREVPVANPGECVTIDGFRLSET